MLSTMDEINTVKEALSLGALDYFTKPLTQEQLKITLTLKVKNALELYEKEKEIKNLYNHFFLLLYYFYFFPIKTYQL